MAEGMFAPLDNNVLWLLSEGEPGACAKIDEACSAGVPIYISPSIVGEIVNAQKDETREGVIDAALRYCDGRLLCDASELIAHELRANVAVPPEIALRHLDRDRFVEELEGLRGASAAANVRAQIAGAFRSPEEWAAIVDEDVQKVKAEHDRSYYRSFGPFCLSELAMLVAVWRCLYRIV